MSLTLLYRGKNVRFSMRLNKLHWLSAVLAFAFISGVVVHLMLSSSEQPTESNDYLSANMSPLDNINVSDDKQSSDKLVALKKQQLTALTIKLAELQSQVLRLNALGERLADNANIPEQEFNFSTVATKRWTCFS